MVKVLGLDASSKSYGWAVVDSDTKTVLDKGCMNLAKVVNLEEKLKIIYDEVKMICTKHFPQLIAIESLFLKNVTTLETLAEVRGVTRLAIYPKPLILIPTATIKMDIGLNKDLETKRLLEELEEIEDELSDSKRAEKMREIKKSTVLRLVNEMYNETIRIDDISDAVAVCHSCILATVGEEYIAPPKKKKTKKAKVQKIKD